METDSGRAYKWVETPVDPSEEHMALRYGGAESDDWSDWTLVARVAAPQDGIFRVEFLLDPSDPKESGIRAKAEIELNFFFVDKKELDPWRYVQYHCTTASNLYSDIHWSYFPTGKIT